MAKKKNSSKDVMLPHSDAKVTFYEKYLERYLAIMSVSRWQNRINIFDVFCGRGVYKDGGLGSPIRAVQVIKKTKIEHPSNTRFHLYLNDLDTHHTENVKQYLDANIPDHRQYVEIHYSNVDAEGLLDRLCRLLPSTPKDVRNLLFIDPYGYKSIHKDTLDRLMSNGRTEILLFLPVSFMHRFTHVAFDERCLKGTEPLRAFISDFFPEDHPVRSDEPMDVQQYISELNTAFSYNGKYYTACYEIQRDKKNYFALFFICSNLLGFEKVVEVKWALDDAYGKGFRLDNNVGMFPELVEFFKQEREEERVEMMRVALLNQLQKGPLNNGDIYKYTLRLGYLPTVANKALKHLQKDNLIEVKPIGFNRKVRKGAFYLNYKDYKESLIEVDLKHYENN
jgi:three-Cys-motif partner protein